MEHFADKYDLVLSALPSAPALHPADDELITASCGGDQAAFAQLFERYRRLVTRQACRFFHRREQVEEIVQESFTDAYFALGILKSIPISRFNRAVRSRSIRATDAWL